MPPKHRLDLNYVNCLFQAISLVLTGALRLSELQYTAVFILLKTKTNYY